MKSVSMYDQIGFPQIVEKTNMPELGGAVSVYEDGSVFSEKRGIMYAPEKEDEKLWRMRQNFDRSHSISPSDRYLTANRERFHAARYGIVQF